MPLLRLLRQALDAASRLIVGEVRQEECLDLFKALGAGDRFGSARRRISPILEQAGRANELRAMSRYARAVSIHAPPNRSRRTAVNGPAESSRCPASRLPADRDRRWIINRGQVLGPAARTVH